MLLLIFSIHKDVIIAKCSFYLFIAFGHLVSSRSTLQTVFSERRSKVFKTDSRNICVFKKVYIFKVRWFYKREMDKDWTPFMGYDSLRIELRYRHIWQTKWSDVDRRTNTMTASSSSSSGIPPSAGGGPPGPRGRRARSLNRNVHYERGTPLGNG